MDVEVNLLRAIPNKRSTLHIVFDFHSSHLAHAKRNDKKSYFLKQDFKKFVKIELIIGLCSI